MDRPTVIIVSDEPEFSAAATQRWLGERTVPSFTLMESTGVHDFSGLEFDLALVGGVVPSHFAAVVGRLTVSGKPVICVTRNHIQLPAAVISIHEVQGWPDLVVVIASRIFACARMEAELAGLEHRNTQLEHQASLGRYILDVRHSLNNALTSILGNSDLLLLDPSHLQQTQRCQIETIRNMAMRLNEIMQRFSSLQKEMQLIEQQGKALHSRAVAGKY